CSRGGSDEAFVAARRCGRGRRARSGRGRSRADFGCRNSDGARHAGRRRDLVREPAGARVHDGAESPAGAADHDDVVHADSDRARDPASGSRHAANAFESAPRRHRAVLELLRDGAGRGADLHGGRRALSRVDDQRAFRARGGGGAASRVHARSYARSGPRAVRIARGPRAARRQRRGRAVLAAVAGFRHERAQDRVPDRLPAADSVSRDRSRRRERADVDGHGHAVAADHLVAVQDHAVRPRRRLVARDDDVGRQLLSIVTREARMTPEAVLEIGTQAMWIAVLLAAPVLLAALAIGVLIGMIQAATQIQEMTLSFIPKLLGVAAVLAFAGSWMLTLVVDWVRE